MQVTGIRSVIDQETLLAACGSGDIVALPAMAWLKPIAPPSAPTQQ
jgi:ATP-dependent protease HslVU (ClpYQ) peptidase subunit